MAMARLHKPFQGTPAMLKMAAEVESACTQRTIDWSDPGAPVNADSIPLVLFFEFDEGCNDVAAFDFSPAQALAKNSWALLSTKTSRALVVGCPVRSLESENTRTTLWWQG